MQDSKYVTLHEGKLIPAEPPRLSCDFCEQPFEAVWMERIPFRHGADRAEAKLLGLVPEYDVHVKVTNWNTDQRACLCQKCWKTAIIRALAEF